MIETYVTCIEICDLLKVKPQKARNIMSALRNKYLDDEMLLPRYNVIPMSWIEAEFGERKPKKKKDA